MFCSHNGCKSLMACLLFTVTISFIVGAGPPATAFAWQDESQATVAQQDDKNSADATQDEGEKDKDDSPLVDSPLENTKPDVPQKVLPPWAKEQNKSDLPELQDLTPRDLLVDVDQGEIEHLYDYDAIEPDDQVLIKILYRLQRFSLEEISHFVERTKSTTPSAIAKAPQANRLQMYRLHGRAIKVERHDLLQSVAENYQLVDSEGKTHNFVAYYRVHAVLEPDNQLATICAVDVPTSWKSAAETSAEIDEPFANSAMFLKVNSREEEPADLLFAAKHVEWYPLTNALDAGLSPGVLLLAKHGFDVSLLQDARARNRKSIDATDTQCFYQLLKTVKNMSAADFSDTAVPEFDLLELMNHSAKNHGHAFNLRADIRNVTEVQIDQDYYQQQLGLDHYYQLDGFVNTDVEIVDPVLKEKGAPGYGKRYPVSVIVASLPEGMQVDSKHIYQVTLPVIFFKIWPYQSQWTRQTNENLEHTAPLLFGVEPTVKAHAATSPFASVVMAVVCLILFGFVWIGFWKLTRKSRQKAPTEFRIGGPKIVSPDTAMPSSAQSSDSTSSSDLPKIDL